MLKVSPCIVAPTRKITMAWIAHHLMKLMSLTQDVEWSREFTDIPHTTDLAMGRADKILGEHVCRLIIQSKDFINGM